MNEAANERTDGRTDGRATDGLYGRTSDWANEWIREDCVSDSPARSLSSDLQHEKYPPHTSQCCKCLCCSNALGATSVETRLCRIAHLATPSDARRPADNPVSAACRPRHGGQPVRHHAYQFSLACPPPRSGARRNAILPCSTYLSIAAGPNKPCQCLPLVLRMWKRHTVEGGG